MGKTVTKQPPAKTPEGRENQCIMRAYDLAEKQLIEGTASSQVITHFLKMGSPREKLDRDSISQSQELTKAKVEQVRSAKNIEELYTKATKAMKDYGGEDDSDDKNI